MKIFTIGHSNHTIEKFLGMCEAHGITMLVDVRSRPTSRYHPQFRKQKLAESLAEAGISYRWGGEYLGGTVGNMGLTPVGDPKFIEKMEAVLAFAEGGHEVALMCSEKDPGGCHRGMKLTAWLHRKYPHVETQHILADGFVDAKAFEATMKPAWLWHEFGGKYGLPNDPA